MIHPGISFWKQRTHLLWLAARSSDAGIFPRPMKSSSRKEKLPSTGNYNRVQIFAKQFIIIVMKTKALFPGSFDPFTAGHLNILKRALTMFDEVVVAVGINQDKRGFFDMDQRIAIISQAVEGLEGVSIIKYDNLTIDTCHELGIHHIVRGVRNMIDFETERSIADANRRLAPDVETIIIPTAQEFAHISSSAVRDILKHHGDTSLFLPEGVVLPEAK